MHKEVVKVDPGINQDIIIRRARNGTLTFRFVDETLEDDFSFTIFKGSQDKSDPVLEMLVANGLIIDGDEIRVPFTEDNSDIDRPTGCYYELKNLTSKQNWYQGKVRILTGESPENTTTEVTGTIRLGDQIVNTVMTLAGSMSAAQIIAALEADPDLLLELADLLGITAEISAAIAALVGGAPATLDIINELAAAINNDPNFAATIATALGLKANSADVTTSLALKADKLNAAVVLVDGASIDITATKHALATSSATRTFTISHTGDDSTIEVTLSAVSSTFTFPAAALCVSEGVASGNNILALAGASGDKYIIGIKKIGSAYYVVCKNFGQ